MTQGTRKIVRMFSDDPAMDSEYGWFECQCWLRMKETTTFPHTDVSVESRYPYRKIIIETQVNVGWMDPSFFDETEVPVA